MHTINRFLLLFLTGVILSCSDASKEGTKGKERKIDAVYQKYIYEKTICPKFVEVIATDKDFIEKFIVSDYREKNDLRTVLSNATVAKSEVVQYLIKHLDYFVIDVEYHRIAGLVHVKDSPIFCAQKIYNRLEELETLGITEKTWDVRKDLLDELLEDFFISGIPWHEGPIKSDVTYLLEEIDKAKKLYIGQIEKQLVKDWVDKAILLLKEQTKEENLVEDAEGFTKEEQIKQIEIWINELRKGLD